MLSQLVRSSFACWFVRLSWSDAGVRAASPLPVELAAAATVPSKFIVEEEYRFRTTQISLVLLLAYRSLADTYPSRILETHGNSITES